MSISLFIPTGDLRQGIARLLGEDEAQGLPWPALSSENLVRICGIPRLGARSPRDLRQITEDLVTGFYASGHPFAFLLMGEGVEISIYWALAGDPPRVSLKHLLSGSLPGVHLAEGGEGEALNDRLLQMPYRALMTGIPSPKRGEGLERLIRGLATGPERSPWAYLVVATPVALPTIACTFETLAEEVRRVKNTYLRRSSIEEDNHPLAQYYRELLKAALSKYRVALMAGAWEVGVALLAARQEDVERGMALLAGIFSGEKSVPRPIRVLRGPTSRNGSALLPSTVLNTPDLALLVQLPQEEMPGYQVFPDARFAVALPQRSLPPAQGQGRSIAIGKVLDRAVPTGQWLELDVEDLAKHAFVTGVTGSGKTESCLFLLDQLWRNHHIPFLVIEPAKQEYRVFKDCSGFQGFKLFTLGDEREAPWRINPFEVPEGIHVQTHIDLLRSLFNASFAGLYAPMPYLLEEALYEIYRERGWDLSSGACSLGGSSRFPTLSDLCAKVEEVVERAGYDPEVTQNVQTALRVRLNSLKMGAKGRMLDSQDSMPMEELLEGPAVLELAAIGDPEVVAFLMGLLWLRLYEHRFAQGPSPLRHITLLEEAHRLLARQIQPSGHPEVSNVRAQAVEVFCNMLAELRAFGEGLIIVDQSPTKLHPDILKNTNLKVVHRLVAKEDREAIGGCTNMSEAQMRALATLTTGQAACYTEGMKEPFLVQVPPFRTYARRSPRKGGRADEPGV
jgi:hypothetical protein